MDQIGRTLLPLHKVPSIDRSLECYLMIPVTGKGAFVPCFSEIRKTMAAVVLIFSAMGLCGIFEPVLAQDQSVVTLQGVQNANNSVPAAPALRPLKPQEKLHYAIRS